MRSSFRRKLMASYVALAVLAGGGAYLAIEHTLAEQLERQLDARLESQAQAVARWFGHTRHYGRLATRMANVVAARVTVIDASGAILGDAEPTGGDILLADSSAPEVGAARQGAIGRDTRLWPARGALMRYVAVPGPDGMVVRLGVPTAEIQETRSSLRGRLLAALSVSLLVAALLGVLVARALSRRLRRLSRMAEQIGRGHYDTEPALPSADELGVLSRTLHLTAAQLRRLDEMRRDFLADVAHELRTPVTSIRGYAETLVASPMDEDTRSEFLQVIHRNALRIAALVDDLLQLQALEDGASQREQLQPVAVARVADNVRRTTAALAEPAGARIDIDVPADLVVMSDPDSLEQILQNLVANGVQHGGAGVRVRISGERRGGRVALTVADDGRGIAAEHLPRLFERFYRVEAGRSSAQGGSGLGLAITRKLTQALGGTIEVHSEPGQGTRFRVELPG